MEHPIFGFDSHESNREALRFERSRAKILPGAARSYKPKFLDRVTAAARAQAILLRP